MHTLRQVLHDYLSRPNVHALCSYINSCLITNKGQLASAPQQVNPSLTANERTFTVREGKASAGQQTEAL